MCAAIVASFYCSVILKLNTNIRGILTKKNLRKEMKMRIEKINMKTARRRRKQSSRTGKVN